MFTVSVSVVTMVSSGVDSGALWVIKLGKLSI